MRDILTGPTNRYIGQISADLESAQDDCIFTWQRLIERGSVLSFRVNGGTLTCGPYQTAVGENSFAAFFYDARGREVDAITERDALSVACWVVEHTGRKQPYNLGS
jgi:hypothetical protein